MNDISALDLEEERLSRRPPQNSFPAFGTQNARHLQNTFPAHQTVGTSSLGRLAATKEGPGLFNRSMQHMPQPSARSQLPASNERPPLSNRNQLQASHQSLLSGQKRGLPESSGRAGAVIRPAMNTRTPYNYPSQPSSSFQPSPSQHPPETSSMNTQNTQSFSQVHAQTPL